MLGLAQPRNAWLPKLYTNNYHMLPRPGDPSIVWGSLPNYISQEGDFGLFDLEENDQVEKIKFDLDETQVWGVGYEISMIGTRSDLNDDII